MSGPYWDVTTCCWQGGAPPQAPPPLLVLGRQDDDAVSRALPVQPTAADAEPTQALAPT